MQFKKILIIIIIILILALGWVIYNILTKSNIAPFRDKDSDIINQISDNIENTPITASATPKSAITKKINKLTKQKILSPIISPDKEHIRYFQKSNGHLLERSLDGTREISILDSDILNLENVIWAPDKKQIIYVLTTSEKYYYNLETGKTVALDKNMKNITWSPDSSKILYEYTDPETKIHGIISSNPNGENIKVIYKTPLQNLNLAWPEQNQITFYQKPSAYAISPLFSINPSNQQIDIIINNQNGLLVHYMPNSQNFIYSASYGKSLNSFAFYARLPTPGTGGQANKSINLNSVTIASKCTLDSEHSTAYCAIAENLEENSILPDDYFKNLIKFKDSIYKIDLETGEKQKIALSSELGNPDAYNLFLSPDKDKLYFTDKNTGILYLINLF